MLSKNERKILKILNDNCYNNSSCLISLPIISALTSATKPMPIEMVEKLVKTLSLSGYIKVIKTIKKGEPYLCVTLTENGKNYNELFKEDLREIKNRFLIATLCAVVSFIVGRILFAIFH